MSLMITGLYAGLLGVLGAVLALHAGTGRLKNNVSLGTGDDTELLVRVRRHGNFIEYVPLALVLILLLELNGTGSVTLHILGLMLLVGRIMHPLGLGMDNMNHPLRFIGTLLTMAVLVAASVMVLWQYLSTF